MLIFGRSNCSKSCSIKSAMRRFSILINLLLWSKIHEKKVTSLCLKGLKVQVPETDYLTCLPLKYFTLYCVKKLDIFVVKHLLSSVLIFVN